MNRFLYFFINAHAQIEKLIAKLKSITWNAWMEICLTMSFGFICNLKFTLLRRFSSLNCPKYCTHALSFYYALIVIFQWYELLYDLFFYFCISTILALVKQKNNIFYLKLAVLYSYCVDGYQHSPNYPHRATLPWKWKLNDLSLLFAILDILD